MQLKCSDSRRSCTLSALIRNGESVQYQKVSVSGRRRWLNIYLATGVASIQQYDNIKIDTAILWRLADASCEWPSRGEAESSIDNSEQLNV